MYHLVGKQWANQNFFDQFSPDFLNSWGKINPEFFTIHSEEKVQEWFLMAKRIIGSLEEHGYVGLVAVTGAGKTVIAYLAIMALNRRSLLLVPQRVMASLEGHLSTFNALGSPLQMRSITGETPAKGRLWNEGDDKIILATAHVAAAEYVNGKLNPDEFGLVVIDEMQHSAGKPWRILSEAFKNRKMIGMSASPFENESHRQKILMHWPIEVWYRPNVIMPEKLLSKVLVEPSEVLQKCKMLCMELLKNRSGALKLTCQRLEKTYGGFGCVVENPFTTKQQNLNLEGMEGELMSEKNLKEVIVYLDKASKYFKAKSIRPHDFSKVMGLYAQYRKITHMMKLSQSGTFGALLSYLKGMEKEKARYAQALLLSEEVATIKCLAENPHPKALKLREVVKSCIGWNQRGLIFVTDKNVGDDLALNYLGDLPENWAVERVYGGRDRNKNKNNETLRHLAKKEIGFVLCTKVLAEGITVPSVDVVILYGAPTTVVEWIQEKGRTGRFYVGQVIVILGSPDDERAYYSLLHKQKTVLELTSNLDPSTKHISLPREKKLKSPSKIKTSQDETLLLFPEMYLPDSWKVS